MAQYHVKLCLRNHLFIWLITASICLAQTCDAADKNLSPARANIAGSERILTFPAGESIGRLSLIPHDYDNLGQEKLVGAAVGKMKVHVPENCWLEIELSRQAFMHPEELDACSAVGLDALKINFLGMDDSESALCDAALRRANHFKNLKCLIFNKSDVSDTGLSALTGQPDIECIVASTTSCTGSCLKTIGQYNNLQYLSFVLCAFKEEYLKYLPNLPRLAYVDMCHTGIGEVGVQYLSKCASLSRLRLSDNGKINDACIKYLLNLKHLSWLAVDGTKISFAGLQALKPLKLKRLTISEGTCNNKDDPLLLSLAKRIDIVRRSRAVDRESRQMYAPLH